MKTLIVGTVLVLAGCASGPSSEGEETVEQFVSHVSGKEVRLYFPAASTDGPEGSATLSGERDSEFGYAGLKQVYAPAYKHCEAHEGALHIVERRAFSKSGPNLPIRFQCRANDQAVWDLGVHYAEKTTVVDKIHRVISLVPHASLLTTADIENRRVAREVPQKLEARLKEKTKQRVESTDKPAVEPKMKISKSDELKLFRKNLKAGERVQWKTTEMPVKGVGQVVRLDGDLALVQFDNQAFTGQSVRYFNRTQLEPFDGIVPARAAP